MAKQNEKNIETQNIKNLLKKKYKIDTLLSANDIIDERNIIIPISPRIDILLNGGLESSSWVNILGKPKRGKTTLTLRMAKCAQDMGYKVVYNNIEHRLKKMNLLGCAGLDLSEDKFMIIQSTKEKLLTNQDFININEDILKSTEKIFCIFDSLSALASGKQMDEGAGNGGRGGASNSIIVSQFCSNMAPVVLINKHIIISICQMMANVTGYGPTSIPKGGETIKYQGDTIITAKSSKEVLSAGKIIGQTVEWECECSSLATVPGTKVESMIRYGEGVDVYWELVEMAKELGIIDVSGSWLTYDKHKVQGTENFNTLLRQDSDLFTELSKKVKERYEA